MSDSSNTGAKSQPVAVVSPRDFLPNLWQFFDPNSPWVLVNEGSLMGFFDFVPRYLRVGPWTTIAPLYISIMVAKLIYWMPQLSSFHWHWEDGILPVHPQYSEFWAYNVIVFFWMMTILVVTLRKRGPGVALAYTVQSWIILTVRHGLSALAPFLPRKHFLLWANELLRFPALATASVTFFYWNFIIAPVIYYNYQPDKRRDFLHFNFNFRMVQLHFFNIIFATMNTIVASSREFQFVDLWCGLAGVVGYALLYLLVLDRIGVHLYPVFSPRTLWSTLSWSAVLGTYFVLFHFWNHIISFERLSIFR